MKRFIIGIIGIMTLILGCTQLGPAEIPLQNDTLEIRAEPSAESPESSPSGAAVAEEPTKNESLKEEAAEEIAIPEVEVQPAAELGPQSTYVTLTDVGFGVPEVRIKVGETVAWKNEREGRQQKAMVLGTQWCSTIVKSRLFGPGEVYRATFNKAGTCTVVDGMYTTETMKVVVEE